MSRKELPKFLIYQATQKEFHICLEVQGKFFRWCSYYLPTLDVRYPRTLTRIEDMPLNKKTRSRIFDKGSYTITKANTKELVEARIAEGIKMKSFSFTLNGKKLQGRFAIKQNSNSTVIQKFKDKFAREEDVLSGDLARTISTMIPDYDEKKVDLNALLKVKPNKTPQPKVQPAELHSIEELTADKEIGGIDYHFTYYAAKNEADICLVTSVKAEVMVLKKEGGKWVMQTALNRTIGKKQKEFTEYASALEKFLDA